MRRPDTGIGSCSGRSGDLKEVGLEELGEGVAGDCMSRMYEWMGRIEEFVTWLSELVAPPEAPEVRCDIFRALAGLPYGRWRSARRREDWTEGVEGGGKRRKFEERGANSCAGVGEEPEGWKGAVRALQMRGVGGWEAPEAAEASPGLRRGSVACASFVGHGFGEDFCIHAFVDAHLSRGLSHRAGLCRARHIETVPRVR